ncbi:hypothetical protein [Sutcliffiella rhizosphaerae]|uniref:YqaE/Pmp3 family membrane protein n=1 Tax=Sutcliffiella rhizosphaerae TaxID=2880967 RepID=A0ABN8AEC0_9BACI|nr:hypothetical protein [Sutcliffiella rhizosphaerae]CAG9623641.1 hypothetical protein BACCIP111883_04459 [Sutcliffiella rhizosphaerae]
MKNNPRVALYVSLAVLIVIPSVFLVISLVTENWKFFMFAIWGSFLGGFPGFVHSMIAIKKEKMSSVT